MRLFAFILLLPVLGLFSIYAQAPEPSILSLKAPDVFQVVLTTTKGDIEIRAERRLSPLAADRFYQLTVSGYFNNIPIYRGVPDFVIQFGTLDGSLDSAWSKYIIEDEPVLASNEAGTLAFARAEKNTRGSQLFINLKNNSRLDTVFYGDVRGFPVFGRVIQGMDIVKSIFTGYGGQPRAKLDSTITDIPAFLMQNFPEMDYIISAKISGKK